MPAQAVYSASLAMPALLGCCTASYDLPLTVTRHFAIAGKGRHYLLMPHILAPRLELFGGLTDSFAEMGKCISKAVRVEIRQVGADERFAEYLADGRGAAPVLPFQT